jgi:hypothetical protein
MFIERFGNLPRLAEFEMGGGKFVKVSDTHAMNPQGQMRYFSPKTVVEVANAVANNPADAGKLVADLEKVRAELEKIAA